MLLQKEKDIYSKMKTYTLIKGTREEIAEYLSLNYPPKSGNLEAGKNYEADVPGFAFKEQLDNIKDFGPIKYIECKNTEPLALNVDSNIKQLTIGFEALYVVIE